MNLLKFCRKLLMVTAIIAPVLTGWARGQDEDVYTQRRMQMVSEYIEREGIKNASVLRAMRDVPRHLFVPTEMKAHAYKDYTIPMAHRQTVSPPYIVAYMTQTIDPAPDDRVLEIGTGSGYQAAVLSKIVKEVYTIEIVEDLGKEAAKRLEKLGYQNVKVKIGDGYQGWKEYAPFDKILVTCSPEDIPQPLVDQLREGGKMIIPLGERYQQMFYLFEKKGGKLVRTKLMPTMFVPMTGKAEEERKVRYDPARPHIANGGFEQITAGKPDVWFYLRQGTVEQSDAPQGKRFLSFSNSDPGRDAEIRQAFGVDGGRVRSLVVAAWVAGKAIAPGPQASDRAGLVVHFFNAENMPITQQAIGPWYGTFNWTQTAKEIRVPKNASMAVIRVGLNGATGSLAVDDVRVESRAR